jgi:dephospho-CoA kinase
MLKRIGSQTVVVIDAPLLIEANLQSDIDKLIVVVAARAVQLSRCSKKRKLKKEEVRARIKNQMPLRTKMRYADFIIDNSGTLTNTRRQVGEIWKKL